MDAMSSLPPQQLRSAVGTSAPLRPCTSRFHVRCSAIDKKPLSSSHSLPIITTTDGIRSKAPWRCWWSSSSQMPENPTTATRRRTSAICMAHPRRVLMVAKQIRRELSTMLITDEVLKRAVLPESSLGADLYLSSVTTITDVEVSRDLQVVKVYVSVFGDERGKAVAIAGLKAKSKYVRSQLGKRIKLRLTPEIRFIEDDSIERGDRVIAILDRLKEERALKRKQRKKQKNGLSDSTDDGDDDDNDDDDDDDNDEEEEEDEWDDEDPDDDIVYVR